MDESSDCKSEELDKWQFTVYWETVNEGISIYSEKKIESNFLSLAVVLSMIKDQYNFQHIWYYFILSGY